MSHSLHLLTEQPSQDVEGAADRKECEHQADGRRNVSKYEHPPQLQGQICDTEDDALLHTESSYMVFKIDNTTVISIQRLKESDDNQKTVYTY